MGGNKVAKLDNRLMVTMIALLLACSFSVQASSWSSFGTGYSRSTEHEYYLGTDWETTIDAIDIYGSSFFFAWDADMGYFIQSSLSFPWDGRIITKTNVFHLYFDAADLVGEWSLSGGFAMRRPFSYGSQFYYGFGPSSHVMMLNVNGETYWDVELGIGLTMGYLYDVTPYTFMDTSVSLDYQFASYGKTAGDESWTKARDFGGYSFRSYVGFGIRIPE